MNDNFGPGQPRVLNVTDRNLDQVVFQQARPPLTSEWNLINQICDLKSQQNLQVNLPSGWVKVGAVEDTRAATTSDSVQEAVAETSARSGQILTSLTYGPDLFKLICRDTSNVAVVNGWPIVVQTNLFGSTNILMTLPPEAATSTYRYDVVFLEVWKKLVSFGDPLYPYGNVQSLAFADNEILWDVIGAETTKRVQTQYRIRTFPSTLYNISVDPSLYPEGLGWSNVKAVGGNTEGNYTTVSFVNSGEKDIGLYIAGDGSPASQELLNTVDGYVYAIPMFMVYRRGSGSLFTPSNIHNNLYAWADANVGTGSDRPDGKYSNIVYSDDIIDLRHQIITSGKDLEDILQNSFRKLLTNQLSTSLGQGFINGTGGTKVFPGGSTLFKQEQLNGHDSSLANIGNGCASPDFKRRVYDNADIISDHNVIEVPMFDPLSTGHWEYGSFLVSTFFSSSIGQIISVDGLYYVGNDLTSGISGAVPNWILHGSSAADFAIELQPSSVIPDSCTVYMEFTFEYNAQRAGFFDVPKKFYEVSKNLYQPIATRDQTIPVRFDNNHNFIAGSVQDCVKYQGGNYTENYQFGHEYLYYIPNQAASNFSITCPNGKLNNYTILGIKTVQVSGVGLGNYGNPLSFSVTKTGNVTYAISTFIPPTPTKDILVTLYTGSGATEEDSFKFFELSKQGRGIIDIYEMILVESGPPDINGNYVIDTGDKPIIAVATYTKFAVGYITGIAFAYDDTTGDRFDVSIVPDTLATPSPNVNSYLPVLSGTAYDNGLLPTRIWLQDAFGAPHNSVTVPVLVHSYVTSSEAAYNFYYRFNAYQGLLSGTSIKKGKIEREGSSVITSEGSGAITNFLFNNEGVSVTQFQRVVTHITQVLGATPWDTYIQPGDYFNVVGSPYYYRILYLGSDSIGTDKETKITLAEPFNEATVVGTNYSIIRLDTPFNNISNVIDVMPTSDSTDFNGLCTDLQINTQDVSTFRELYEKDSLQSPLDTIVNDFQLGLSKPTSSRGRTYFRLTDGKNGFFKLGLKTTYIKYRTLVGWDTIDGDKKVFQAYLYNEAYYDAISGTYRDLTGRIYLMVVSSETNNDSAAAFLNGFSDLDAVDIFELSGKPIIKTE